MHTRYKVAYVVVNIAATHLPCVRKRSVVVLIPGNL